ncbi:MAG: S1 RNA-binding domain-containing protein [Chitinophagaceae bacterium]
MLQIGTYHTLEILRLTPPGLFLGDGDKDNEVLLPNKYIPEHYEIGDSIRVFVYQDFDERVVATTLTPNIELNGFALLEVVDNSKIGTFMDWGLEKDLLVPFSEQNGRMRIGGRYLIYMYFDEVSGRLVGTQKYKKFLSNEDVKLKEGDEVDIIIADNTPLGVNVIVNGRHRGLIYHDDIFKNIESGESHKGYIRKIREENKLDISLQPIGFAAIEPNADKIMALLRMNKGKMAVGDNSSPELIYEQFGMSKKLFKKSLGLLYRQKLIRMTDDGIELV